MLSGVENLRVMSQVLKSIDKVTETEENTNPSQKPDPKNNNSWPEGTKIKVQIEGGCKMMTKYITIIVNVNEQVAFSIERCARCLQHIL